MSRVEQIHDCTLYLGAISHDAAWHAGIEILSGGCLFGCQLCYRSCGGQFLRVIACAQGVSPLQLGALASTGFFHASLMSALRIHRRHETSPLDSVGAYHQQPKQFHAEGNRSSLPAPASATEIGRSSPLRNRKHTSRGGQGVYGHCAQHILRPKACRTVGREYLGSNTCDCFWRCM